MGESSDGDWGRNGTKGVGNESAVRREARAIYINEVGGLAKFDAELRGVIKVVQAARREGALQGAWERWQQRKGDSQREDKLQKDKLSKLQAGKNSGR